jgi:hypothetical protein
LQKITASLHTTTFDSKAGNVPGENFQQKRAIRKICRANVSQKESGRAEFAQRVVGATGRSN